MSFTTRCPSCGTVFRVVADQLKISDGWVRCGHCSDVFDATIDLNACLPPAAGAVVPPTADAEAGRKPAPAPEAQPGASLGAQADDDLQAWFGEGPLDAPDAQAAKAAEQAQPPLPAAPEVLDDCEALDPAPDAHDGYEPLEPAQLLEPEPPQPGTDPLDVPSVSSMLTMASHESDEPAVLDGESDFHAELERFAHSTRAPLAETGSAGADAPHAEAGEAAHAALSTEQANDARPAADSDSEQGAAEAVADADAEPGFVREARRQAFWSSPRTRTALSLLAVVLALLLAGQWAYHARHSVVAAQPALKPWVQRACGWLGCDLAPVRRLDAIVIESAELVRRLGNFYSFDIVLRNQSALEVALPALELALTDSGEHVVARRVFLPQDWPETASALAPDGRVSVSFRLSLSLGEGVPTAGYRALVFYP